MVPFQLLARQAVGFAARRASLALLLIALLSGWNAAQSARGADLKGCVRDSAARPIAGASVALETTSGTPTLRTLTDPEGTYEFSMISAGTYKLRIQRTGYAQSISDPFSLKADETKQLDFTLQHAEKSSPQTPEFFDEPTFTVAGVTDTTSIGSHGSDTVVRTTESLVRETASLSKSSANSPPNASLTTTENSLRAAVQREPISFEANHRLGKMLLEAGKSREAAPYLDQAERLNPRDNENTYDLARACADIGEYARAESNLRALLNREDSAQTHHLLADVDEKLGHPLDAVHQYQRAAEMVPSESNLFDWGTELLMHRALEPAGEVFTKGNRLFPVSSRMFVGLGVTLYARGSYEQAVRRLCEASDLDPGGSMAYLFMGKIQTIEPAQSRDVTERLARFVKLQPENAIANYYYAVSLWKARTGPEDRANLREIELRLSKAVQLDPHLGAGFLQLGVLYEEQKKLPDALAAYQQAITADPQLEQAHYRLAQFYRKTGDLQKAAAELELYKEASRQSVEQAEREQREIRGFVYTLRDRPSGTQSEKPPTAQ
jgi:tetratricopeptide (TPR) repeat protein